MTIVQGTAHEKTWSKLVMEFAVTKKSSRLESGVVPDLGMAPRQDVNCCDVPDKEQDLALLRQCRN